MAWRFGDVNPKSIKLAHPHLVNRCSGQSVKCGASSSEVQDPDLYRFYWLTRRQSDIRLIGHQTSDE